MDAYSLVRQLIVDGRLAPGNPIPMSKVERRYGIGRHALREALHRLCREAFAERVQSRRVPFRAAPIRPSEAWRTFELIGMLEGLGARRLAECPPGERKGRADGIGRALAGLSETLAAVPADGVPQMTAFNRIGCILTGDGEDPLLSAQYDAVRPHADRYIRFFGVVHGTLGDSVPLYDAVRRMISIGDPESAEKLAREVWRAAAKRIDHRADSVEGQGEWP